VAGNDRYFITAILLATLLLLATMAGVAGASEPAAAPPGAAGYNASVLPLANGYWTKTFDGAAGLEDGASAVCCDPMGDAFVAGTTNTGGGAAGYVLWIRKYSGTDGATLWTKTHASPVPGPGNASARGVSCDPEGNPVVAGFVWNGTDLDIWVRKYRGADGATLWTKTYDGGDVDVA